MNRIIFLDQVGIGKVGRRSVSQDKKASTFRNFMSTSRGVSVDGFGHSMIVPLNTSIQNGVPQNTDMLGFCRPCKNELFQIWSEGKKVIVVWICCQIVQIDDRRAAQSREIILNYW